MEFMNIWNVNESRFLPTKRPLKHLAISDIKNTEIIYTWENLIEIIPHLLQELCAREEIIYALRKSNQSYYHNFIDSLGDAENYERTFLILAYFATTYLNAFEGGRKIKLAKEISVPFTRVAHLVSRPPVLDYTSFVLYNWKLKDENLGFVSENIEVLHTFTNTEQFFLRNLVQIEYSFSLCELSNPSTLLEFLIQANERLSNVSSDFKGNWEIIAADYTNVLFEQWKTEPVTFPCDIFLQCPILAFFCKWLDISISDGYLNKRRQEMDRPQSHKQFLNGVSSIRPYAMKDHSMREIYNCCLWELGKFYNSLAVRESDQATVSVFDCALANSFIK